MIGAILAILGREPFGLRHSRYMLISIVIYLAGILALAIVTSTVSSDVSSVVISGANKDTLKSALSASLNQFLISIFITGAVVGISQVLFSYAIQNRRGRTLLWIGYASTLAIGAAIFLVIGPQISGALDQGFSSTTYDAGPLQALLGQVESIQLLNIVPAIFFALAYYSIVVRIRVGETSNRG